MIYTIEHKMTFQSPILKQIVHIIRKHTATAYEHQPFGTVLTALDE